LRTGNCPLCGVLGTNQQPKEKAMTRQVERFMEFSTAHISAKDRDLLNEDETFGLVCHNYKFGYLIFTDCNKNILKKSGFSDEFINLIKEAEKEDCYWLRLDGINPIYDDLPTFDW
jgi:hypothetical protein